MPLGGGATVKIKLIKLKIDLMCPTSLIFKVVLAHFAFKAYREIPGTLLNRTGKFPVHFRIVPGISLVFALGLQRISPPGSSCNCDGIRFRLVCTKRNRKTFSKRLFAFFVGLSPFRAPSLIPAKPRDPLQTCFWAPLFLFLCFCFFVCPVVSEQPSFANS